MSVVFMWFMKVSLNPEIWLGSIESRKCMELVGPYAMFWSQPWDLFSSRITYPAGNSKY